MKQLALIIEDKRKKRDGTNDDIGKLEGLSVHSDLGFILFLNADIDNRFEAGKISRCSNGAVKAFGA